jgi:UDP-N-acetylglucosamine 1-carboxyvinyltransferase
MPSVGATENILLSSVLAKGSTILSNAAQEPEIMDLINFLNALGADIHGAGTSELVINGVDCDSLKGITYAVVPDRIEAATYMMAVAACSGDVVIENVIPAHLGAVIHKLTDMGVDVTVVSPNSLRIRRSADQPLLAQNLVTQPYPGFPTDLQAPMMSLNAIAEGVSVVTENIYENRFKHIGELQRMGANIQQEGNVAIVTGVNGLTGTQVKASDLRAGAALVIAGLLAAEQTEISDLHHLDRGYEKLVEKFTSLGAYIQRLPKEDEHLAPSVTA